MEAEEYNVERATAFKVGEDFISCAFIVPFDRRRAWLSEGDSGKGEVMSFFFCSCFKRANAHHGNAAAVSLVAGAQKNTGFKTLAIGWNWREAVGFVSHGRTENLQNTPPEAIP